MVDSFEVLQKALPNLSGVVNVEVEGSIVVVSGTIRGASSKEVLEVLQPLYQGYSIVSDLEEESRGLVVVTQDSDKKVNVSSGSPRPLDEIRVVYQGDLPTKIIVDNTEYKFGEQKNPDRMKASIDVLDFFTPLVLDQNLTIIDGHMRLMAAKLNDRESLPVIIVEVDEIKRDFLRLALNRSSEFQRWLYDEVDAFVDSHPQLQPVLEPLGFFGTTVLPESFFSDTVIQYKIDPFSNQQSLYRQEYSLAEWASKRREEILAADEKRKESRKKKDTKGLVSLFDLEVSEEDKLPTYDPQFELEQHAIKVRDDAGDITDRWDEIRIAVLEEKGEPFHKNRVLASEVGDINRQLFFEYLEDLEFSQDEIKEILKKTETARTFDKISSEVKKAAKETGKTFTHFNRWKKSAKNKKGANKE